MHSVPVGASSKHLVSSLVPSFLGINENLQIRKIFNVIKNETIQYFYFNILLKATFLEVYFDVYLFSLLTLLCGMFAISC